jgi:hypothetical protein
MALDGRDGFQIWRVAASIFSKQSLIAYKWCFSILGVGLAAINFSL